MQDILATSTTCHTDSVTSEFLSILHKCLNLEENFDFRFPFGGDHPNRYDIPDINRFRDEYLFSNIVRKYAGPSSDSASLRNRAIEDALAAEAHCSQHYTRFNNQGSFGSLRATPEAVLFTAAAHCSAVLGEFNWAEVFKSCDYGPGASTTLAKKLGDRYYKIGDNAEVSTGCVPILEDYFCNFRPLWKGFLQDRHPAAYTICDWNRISTVPKDFKKDRPIAVEPGWNMFFQKGIGEVMRSRLRRYGNNLKYQDLNQQLAYYGSRDGTWCTIDLSSASDTVSDALVFELLPSEWYGPISQVRCHLGKLAKWFIQYHKVSSMGCGFTFELETLVFRSLVYAVDSLMYPKAEGRRVMCYGDDICCRPRSYEAVLEVLQWCGFIPNQEKSFGSGPFRESCGKHWASGHDVSPFFIKTPLTRPDGSVIRSEVFLAYNNLTRWSMRRYPGARDSRVLPALKFLQGLVAPEWRKPTLFDGFGDGAFIGSFDEVCPKVIYDPDTQQTLYEMSACIPFRYKLKDPRDWPRLLKSLHLCELNKLGDEGTKHGGRLGKVRKNFLVSSAPSIGPFINFLTGDTE